MSAAHQPSAIWCNSKALHSVMGMYAACAVRALLDAKDVIVHNPTVLDVDLGEVGCNADCSQV